MYIRRYLSHGLCDFAPEASGDLSQPEAPNTALQWLLEYYVVYT